MTTYCNTLCDFVVAVALSADLQLTHPIAVCNT